jgi:hypothetical protein
MKRINSPLIYVLAITGIAVGSARATDGTVPADTLFGASGTYSVTIDQNDGAITPFAPQGTFGFIALAFDSGGKLFAAGCAERGTVPVFTNFCPTRLLMELDPQTGEVVEVIGPVTDVLGSEVNITALSVQPETDVLFGFDQRFFPSSSIWTIDKSTAVATLIASEVPAGCGVYDCSRTDAFAFAPDGTLYHFFRDPYDPQAYELMTLDPRTGAEISSVPIDFLYYFFTPIAGLAVRSDGVIFSNSLLLPDKPPRDWAPASLPNALTTIDPQTGAMTEVGTDGGGPLDLDFSPVVVEWVDLDIKPGSDSNPILLSERGKIPVAILGSDIFDVLDVDVTTLAFGPGAAAPSHDLTKSGAFESHLRDVNEDGLTDLLTHYRIEDVGIERDGTEVCLFGQTLESTPFEGCDAIRAIVTGRDTRR